MMGEQVVADVEVAPVRAPRDARVWMRRLREEHERSEKKEVGVQGGGTMGSSALGPRGPSAPAPSTNPEPPADPAAATPPRAPSASRSHHPRPREEGGGGPGWRNHGFLRLGAARPERTPEGPPPSEAIERRSPRAARSKTEPPRPAIESRSPRAQRDQRATHGEKRKRPPEAPRGPERVRHAASQQIVPRGIRTPVATVKGWSPGPLDDGD